MSDNPTREITRLISEAVHRYPGGLRAIVRQINDRNSQNRCESAFYADFNPNPTSKGNLKVSDLIAAIEITGDRNVLHYIAAYFGYTLTRLGNDKADAQTVDAEMLQDYPAVVNFHKAVQDYQSGKCDYTPVLANLCAATTELTQTANLARKCKE